MINYWTWQKGIWSASIFYHQQKQDYNKRINCRTPLGWWCNFNWFIRFCIYARKEPEKENCLPRMEGIIWNVSMASDINSSNLETINQKHLLISYPSPCFANDSRWSIPLSDNQESCLQTDRQQSDHREDHYSGSDRTVGYYPWFLSFIWTWNWSQNTEYPGT